MKPQYKYKAVSDYYKLMRSDYVNTMDWFKAVKKAANMENDSIEVIYDKVILKKSVPANVTTIDAKATEIKSDPKATESVKAGDTKVDVAGAAQRVDVSAPVIQVNIPAPVVQTRYGEGSWLPVVERIGSHMFTFAAGTMAGVLVAKLVLGKFGLA